MKHPNGDESTGININAHAPRAGLERWHANEKLKLLKAYEPIPEPDWISEQRLARNTLNIISAAPKAGKSMLCLELAIGAASGTGAVKALEGGWLFPFKRRTRTYYLDTENGKGITLRRLASICKDRKLDHDQLLSEGWLTICCLRDSEGSAPFRDEETAKGFGVAIADAGIEFVIADTMSDCYHTDASAMGENDSPFMREFMNLAMRSVDASKACLLFVHHHVKGASSASSSQGKAAGSSQMLRKAHSLYSCSFEGPLDSDLIRVDFTGREFNASGSFKITGRALPDGGAKVFEEAPEGLKVKAGRPPKLLKELARVQDGCPKLKASPWTKDDWLATVMPFADQSKRTTENWLTKGVEAGFIKSLGDGRYTFTLTI